MRVIMANDTPQQQQIIALIRQALQLNDDYPLDGHSPLLGAIPEFDSMAVITLITELESYYDFTVSDDEIDAEVFTTVETVRQFVTAKQQA